MELKTWEDAAVAAQEYAEAVSQRERLEEELKAFCERRREQVGKERLLGPVKVGFRKIPDQVRVPADALPWLGEQYPEFVEQKPVADKPELKRLLKRAAEAVVNLFRDQGVVYSSSYEKFFVRLVNARCEPEERSEL